jgi:uncharacterized protein (TIGR03435 family)
MRHAILSSSVVILGCAGAFGQTASTFAFEVASVKPSAPVPPTGGVYFGPPRGGPGTPDPGQITWTYALLRNILMTAYDIKDYQINGPSWIGSERFDIVVKVPEGATKNQVRVMWQNLLAERFGLTLHHESKEFQVDELVIAKGGPKLKETPEADPGLLLEGKPPKLENGRLAGPGMVNLLRVSPSGLITHTIANAQPISKLTELLSHSLYRPVLDKTQLAGTYDFTFEFTTHLANLPLPPPPPPGSQNPIETASDPVPDLPAALQQQLGLRLVPSKAALDVLVIDKLEKVPTEN